jgi:hypothetical protein
MSDILNKLKQLRQKLELQKTDELRKEVIAQVGGTQDKVHGWISPIGDYHKMPPKENHFHAIEQLGYEGHDDPIEGAYKDGWLSVGHAGLQNVRGHSKYLSDPSHPAVRTSRQLVGQHLFGNVSIWHMDKQDDIRGVEDVDAQHWSKHGTIPAKGSVAEFHKSDDKPKDVTKMLHLEHYSDKKLDTIDPSMHGTGVPGEEKEYIGDINYQPRSYHYVAGSKPELLLGI